MASGRVPKTRSIFLMGTPHWVYEKFVAAALEFKAFVAAVFYSCKFNATFFAQLADCLNRGQPF